MSWVEGGQQPVSRGFRKGKVFEKRQGSQKGHSSKRVVEVDLIGFGRNPLVVGEDERSTVFEKSGGDSLSQSLRGIFRERKVLWTSSNVSGAMHSLKASR